MKFSVIIVNYNSAGRLKRCLEHLNQQTYRDFETIVFDNASDDNSVEQALVVAADAKIIRSSSNIGFAAANNRAAEIAAGEWIAFLNPDAYADPTWLEELSNGIHRYSFADAFGSAQLNAEDPSVIDGAGDVFHVLGVPYRGAFGKPATSLPEDGECFAPCAAAAAYRSETFRKLGGFDERFFCYGEDVDLGFRLRLAGGRAVQLRNARVLHEGSGVTGRYSDFTVYHGHRNRIWTTFKNMPGLIYWPLFPVRLLADFCLCVRAISTGVGRAYLRAFRDGYLGLDRLLADRRRLQEGRTASLASIAAALTWSPLKALRREAALRMIPSAAPMVSAVRPKGSPDAFQVRRRR